MFKLVLHRMLAFNGDNVIKIAQLGGIECILTALRLHVANEDVQDRGCNSLRDLAASDANKVKIVQLGGIGCYATACRSRGCSRFRLFDTCDARAKKGKKDKIVQLGGVGFCRESPN
jgi:hypothetical protein